MDAYRTWSKINCNNTTFSWHSVSLCKLSHFTQIATATTTERLR